MSSSSEADDEEEGDTERPGKKSRTEDEMKQCMMLMANTVTSLANMAATRAAGGGSGDAKDGADGKLPGMRDLMGGFKRLKAVGPQHFMLERTMRRQRRSVMMAEHLPFAKKYNKRMEGLLVVETRKMECELQLRQLQALVETEEVLRKITEKEVRLKMITEEWLVIDDTLDLLQGCSDKACKGKVAQAWQMWDDAQEEQQGCSKTAEMKKRETAAEANLKEKAQTDQALYLAMQLGQQSALYGGQDGNSFKYSGRTRLWAAAAAAGVAGAAAAAAVARAATTGAMATARGARPEADATRATTTESFPGPGTAEGGWKREGEDGGDLLYTDTVQLWQGRGCARGQVPSESEGGLGAIAGADEVWEVREVSSGPTEASGSEHPSSTLQAVLEDASSMCDLA